MGQDRKYSQASLGGRTGNVTAQDEVLLVRLMEECGEAIQAASKVLRWSWMSKHPNREGETNAEALERELKDIKDIEQRLRDNNALSGDV